MAAPEWLTARPIAHRGLHDPAAGIIENTASAANAAIANGYAIETDVQLSADGEAMVFHDDTLERLTQGHGAVAGKTAAELREIAFQKTADRMPTLGEYCDLIAGRAPLIVEIKSRFDGDLRLVRRVTEILKPYAGPVAAMSFDPEPVAALRHLARDLLRGIVAEWRYDHPEWKFLTAGQRRNLSLMLHARHSRPQFVAYCVDDLPSPVSAIARSLSLPLLTWTVRTDAQRTRAGRYADQMIFEGFRA